MSTDDEQILLIRDFNRFYTRQIGLLEEGLLKSDFSLTEARVLYELAQQKVSTATALRDELNIDEGYLSRLLKKFEKQKLIKRSSSTTDARQAMVQLTAHGRKAFEPLNRSSTEQVANLLAPLSPVQRATLTSSMRAIKAVLRDQKQQQQQQQQQQQRHQTAQVPFILRPLQVGDIGWIIHRQGTLYAQEYGWDERFEALVAEIAGAFVRNFDSSAERCWIAERNDEVVGSVFVVKENETIAKLRLLYVEPSARGLGIGRKLVDECIRFARNRKYQILTLWTNDVLLSARKIYEAAGFKLIKEERHHSFGKDLLGQNWNLELGS